MDDFMKDYKNCYEDDYMQECKEYERSIKNCPDCILDYIIKNAEKRGKEILKIYEELKKIEGDSNKDKKL